MKLKHRVTYARKTPRPGDIRVIRRFALLPVILDSDKTAKLWLESYKVIQVFTNHGRYHFHGNGMTWVNHWLWCNYVLVSNGPINGRILVKERKRIKEEMKKNGSR
jgi:hypothetical protein